MAHTFESVLSLIYQADPEVREVGAFTCDPATFRELRVLHDSDGRYLVASPRQKNEPPRLLGFPVIEKLGHDGLTFGKSSP